MPSNHAQSAESKRWSAATRLKVSLPIFIVMMGILIGISSLTNVPWKISGSNQAIETSTSDTSVTFENDVAAAKVGTYQVRERMVTFEVRTDGTVVGEPFESSSESTDESAATKPILTKDADGHKVQRIRVRVREPENAASKTPALVFMHGAGYGSCDNSFNDIAADLASAGIATAVPDKPVWSSTDLNRDYEAAAHAYDAVVQYMRSQSGVDSSKVGIYAISESTWVASYLMGIDSDIDFQIQLSPMVWSPRKSMGFFVSQDFEMAGANQGFQGIVRRVFSADMALFGLHNFDLATLNARAYSIPTFVVYGGRDVMTAQVDGTHTILDMATQAGNSNVIVRRYAGANHVLRMGEGTTVDTPLPDGYERDLISWITGVSAGQQPSGTQIAGETITQTVGVSDSLHARRVLTIYGVVLHVVAILLILASVVLGIVAVVKRRKPSSAFSGALILLTLTTVGTLVLLGLALGAVVVNVIKLAWGGDATANPGIMQWSWPAAQIVSVLVVWAFSRLFARLIEEAAARGLIQLPPRKGAWREVISGAAPVVAETRLGRVLFWLVTFAVLHLLLVFAFWGLFIY